MTNELKTYPRLLSLDVFRGLTILLMIIVNSPGSNTAYPWLTHSDWNGCTLADLVFPFFIFIVGVSSVFTLSRSYEAGKTSKQLFHKILERSVILFLIGLLLNAFPSHFDFANLRICGVLQRIAICYFISACLFLHSKITTQALVIGILLIAYWLIMTLVPVPGYGAHHLSMEGNAATYLDRLIFSPAHLYHNAFDPEGLLSTLPAIATALIGNLTGVWLLSVTPRSKKFTGLFIAGFIALILGWIWGLSFPINKQMWTSSYVLWTGGFALIILAVCYWLIEIKVWKKWTRPFEILGMNAMLAYLLHVLFLKIQAIITMPLPDGSEGNLRLFITDNLFGWASTENASLMYACSYAILWLLVIKFYMDQKARIR